MAESIPSILYRCGDDLRVVVGGEERPVTPRQLAESLTPPPEGEGAPVSLALDSGGAVSRVEHPWALNPYYFIDIGDRPANGPLADRDHVGHGRYGANALHGRLAACLEVVTPLLLPDAAAMWAEEPDDEAEDRTKPHFAYPVLLRNGAIHLPPSSLKGMLRSAFEIVTLSRAPFDSERGANHPALEGGKDRKALSPAERVFGTLVAEKGAQRKNAVPLKGHLRVGPATCLSEPDDALWRAPDGRPIPLAILAAPTPKHESFYGRPGPGRRGPKVYPHQKGLARAYWEAVNEQRTPQRIVDPDAGLDQWQEFLRPGGLRDRLNRSVEGWVRPGTRFDFPIVFDNLSEIELGALLWLLDRPEDDEACFRLGFGKPLGFGSVRLRLRPHECRVEDGNQRRQSLLRLGRRGGEGDDADRFEALSLRLRQTFAAAHERQGGGQRRSVLDQWNASARGLGRPGPQPEGRFPAAHYPRAVSILAPDSAPPAPRAEPDGRDWFRAEPNRRLPAIGEAAELPVVEVRKPVKRR